MNQRVHKRAKQQLLILKLATAVKKQGEQILDELEKALNIDNQSPVYPQSEDYPEPVD